MNRMSRRDALRRMALVGLGAPLAAEALAACGGSGGGPTPGSRRSELVIGQSVDPRSLWANSSTTQQEINVSEQITEKLFEFSSDGTKIEPRLAKSWQQVDPRTLEISLRQGVTFTNGEPFNAQSAKFSLDTARAAFAYKSFLDTIQGVEVVDDHTIRVTTVRPTLLHMPELAYGSYQYPPALFQQLGPDGFGAKPVGTGPYTLAAWTKGDKVQLQANPRYWDGAPAIKKVTFRIVPDATAAMAALQSGQIQLMIDVPLDSVEEVQNRPELKLATRPSSRAFVLMLSTLSDTPLRDPKVRQALWHAIDVKGLIKGLFRGHATPLQGQFAAPSYRGFDKDLQAPRYDPAKARSMLAAAGHPNFTITFKYTSGRYVQDKEVGQAIAAQLAKVGVQTTQQVMEPGTFLTELSALKLNDMFLFGSLPPLDAHFQYQSFRTGFRYSYYSNPRLDALLDQEAGTADEESRQKTFQQIARLLAEDPPFVPLYQPEDTYGMSQDLHGFTPRASQFLDIRRWSFE